MGETKNYSNWPVSTVGFCWLFPCFLHKEEFFPTKLTLRCGNCLTHGVTCKDGNRLHFTCNSVSHIYVKRSRSSWLQDKRKDVARLDFTFHCRMSMFVFHLFPAFSHSFFPSHLLQFFVLLTVWFLLRGILFYSRIAFSVTDTPPTINYYLNRQCFIQYTSVAESRILISPLIQKTYLTMKNIKLFFNKYPVKQWNEMTLCIKMKLYLLRK